jgi:exodeoxyribonuclease V gamma subunit
MLRIYEDHDLVQLAEFLETRWNRQPSNNLLLSEQIIVQNNEMARWLSLFLAEKEGIAANLDFMFPAELFWKITRILHPNIPDQLPSDRGPLAWSIFRLLQANNDAALSVLHQYTNHEEPHIQEMRSWNLACRISDVFDQYLSFRSEMILTWGKNQLMTKFDSEQWQAHLWCSLLNQWQDGVQEDGAHRAKLQQQFFAAVENGTFPSENLPHRFTLFGKIDAPPGFFKVVMQLAKLTDIDFYRQKIPAKQENALTKSFNQKGRESEEILNKCLSKSGVTYECQKFSADQGNVDDPGNKAKSLFATLKNDIKFGESGNKPEATDPSFQIHSCHSPRREVEVLYDQLLFLMDHDENLAPSDTIIVSPQIEEYAAEIEAVFGAPEEGIPRIPFHILGISRPSGSVEAGFRKFLKLVNSRFKVTDVVDFLECEPIKDKLELSEENLNMLNSWIGEKRIRWGMDGSQKKLLDLPGSKHFTWQSGLHSMMAGFSMEPAGDTLFHGIYPYKEIGQADHGLLLGKLSQFMHQLFQCHKQAQKPKTPEAWRSIIRGWLFKLFSDDLSTQRQMNRIAQIIDALAEETAQAGWKGGISWQIVCNYLENALDLQPSRSSQSGGVTFCSMITKRGIPAKIIGMIGMNDGAFPQLKTTPGFDLISKKPQKGDRSPSKDGRQQFLDCILAATNGIYFSFVGQSDRTDAEYPPSTVLQELIEYVSEHYSIDEKELIQKHGLQPFSPYYFDHNESGFFSYSRQNQRAAQQLVNGDSERSIFLSEPLPEPEDALKKITLRAFISFFQHPAKFLLQRRLGIYFPEDDFLDEDRETFLLSPLEKSHFDRELGSRYLKNQSLRPYYEVAKAKNLLPDGWAGHQAYDQQLHQVEAFGKIIKSNIHSELLDPIEVQVQRGDFRITGSLDSVYANEQILYRFGKMRPKDLIELWIKHLLLQTTKPPGNSGESRFIYREKKNGKTKAYFFKLNSPPDPGKILDDLITIYQNGLCRYALFFQYSSYYYAEALKKDKDEQEALRTAQKKWFDPHQSYPNEREGPYNKCMSNGLNPLDDNKMISYFKKNSQLFWKPFFEVLEVTNKSL